MTKYPPIDDSLSCQSLLQISKARKHSTMKTLEYEELEKIYINFFFANNPHINRKSMATWAVARLAKENLLKCLKAKGIIVLPPQPDKKLHPFETTKKGLLRLVAIERKIKLFKKLHEKVIK
jgi:hypothetical protein